MNPDGTAPRATRPLGIAAVLLLVAAAAFGGMAWARVAFDLAGSPTGTEKGLGWAVFAAALLTLLLVPVVLGWRSRARLWPEMAWILGVLGGVLGVCVIAEATDADPEDLWLSALGGAAVAAAMVTLFSAAFFLRRAMRDRAARRTLVWSAVAGLSAMALYCAAYFVMWSE